MVETPDVTLEQVARAKVVPDLTGVHGAVAIRRSRTRTDDPHPRAGGKRSGEVFCQFFGKDVVELRLSKIQNISYNIPGFTGELFGFGTIVIQTFVGDLVIHKVEHPDKIYNKLQDAVSAATHEPGQGEYEETI